LRKTVFVRVNIFTGRIGDQVDANKGARALDEVDAVNSVGERQGRAGSDDAGSGCSVTIDGGKSSAENTSGFRGTIPVFRKPQMAFSRSAHFKYAELKIPVICVSSIFFPG